MSNFGKLFGELIRRKREDRGWSFAQLAIAAYGDDKNGGESRKSDVQKLEAGNSRKPNAATIRKYRLALDLTQEEIDACRNPQELELAHFADELFQVIAQAATALDLTEDYALAVSERYAEGNPNDFQGALNGVKLAMEDAAKERARGSNLPDIEGILAEVQALNDAGEIDEADVAIEADLARRRDDRERQKAEDSRLLERAIQQAVTTRNAEKLANRTLELVRLEAPSAEDQFHRLRALQDELYETGLRYGTSFALDSSIGLAKKCVEIAPGPNSMAIAQNDLAIALANQGIRTEGEAGTRHLAEAVSTYREVLKFFTREDHPVDWAMTQNNLGNDLKNQGMRTGGEDGIRLLAEAVAAYRDALTIRTKDDHPVDWAITQNNLGNALKDQGSHTGGKDGTRLLAEAVTAYRDALTISTKDDHPVQWAISQNNLGGALQTQGSRTGGEDGTRLLAEAFIAYREALTIYTKADHPVQWALTQSNLGSALATQGGRTGGEEGIQLFKNAIEVWSDALTIRTKADHPVQWAMTQENLAIAEKAIADHDTTTASRPHLEAALEHVEAALTIYDPEHMSYNFEKASRLRDELKERLKKRP